MWELVIIVIAFRVCLTLWVHIYGGKAINSNEYKQALWAEDPGPIGSEGIRE